ncbi:MAG: hypothetical protein QF473_30250 [Planctomycetota bacterium]|nr:hypothetical protein [Planctomycetota bacterium]
MALPLLLTLLCSSSPSADESWRNIPTEVPLRNYLFKYANYVCFWVGAGETAPVKLINEYKPGRDWKNDVFFQVFGAGGTLAERPVPPGMTHEMSVTSKTGEVIIIFMTSRRTHHRVDVGDRPWAFLGHALKGSIYHVSPRKYERLYFPVPEQADHLDVRLYVRGSQGKHAYLIGPDGKVGVDYVIKPGGLLSPHVVWRPLPAEVRGKVCSWVLPNGHDRYHLTPSFNTLMLLSPSPDHAAFFAEKLKSQKRIGRAGETGPAKVPERLLQRYEPMPREESPDTVGCVKPLIYCQEYLHEDRVLNPKRFVRWLTASGRKGPNVLELGLHGPFSTSYGDSRDINPWSSQAILPDLSIRSVEHLGVPVASMAQMKRKAELFKAMNETLAAAGVEQRLIYTSARHGYYGNAETRTGVFHLYDHWEEYRKHFPDLGERPVEPPEKWSVWTETGPMGPAKARQGKDLYRYIASLNNKSWKRFFGAVIAVAARYGASGVHIDTAGQHHCGSPDAEAGFKRFLLSRYTPAQIKELFGFKTPDQIRQPPRPRGWVDPKLIDIERARYHLGVVTPAFWDAAREAGESVRGKGNFWVHAASEESREHVVGAHDSIMFEEAERFIGLIEREMLPGIVHRRYGSLAFEYKSDQGYAHLPLSQRVRMTGGILKYNRTYGEYAIRLAIAEGAALSSGGGGMTTLSPGYVFDVMRRFFELHPRLYDGCVGAAPVGFYQDFENRIIFYNHEEHIAANTRVTEELAANQIPFDFIPRAAAKPEVFDRYPLISALSCVMIAQAKMNGLDEFAMRGGLLLVDDKFALENEYKQPREALPWGDCVGKSGYDIRHGLGRVISVPSPAAAKDVLAALEKLLGRSPAIADPVPGLRTNLMHREDAMIVHLLNYNVPLDTAAWNMMAGKYTSDPRKPRPIRKVQLNLTIPSGKRVAGVEVLTPDFEVTPTVDQTVEGNLLTLTVSDLFIYNVVRVRLMPDP